MVRSSTQYVCQQCGYSQVGWAGRCPNCQAWGSLVETFISTQKSPQRRINKEVTMLELTAVKAEGLARITTGILELDQVLGGGLVPGQAVLLAGEPGIGKSTLLSQIADKIYPRSVKKQVIYVSGEESASQVKLRTRRLGVLGEGVFVIEETDVDVVVEEIKKKENFPNILIIVDSIQTLSTADLTGSAGSVGQVRESAARLITLCKQLSMPLFLVGHVTKEGNIAGPRVLEHMVDTVLWFEGDRSHTLRLLRAIKNRFGPTDEVGVFQMTDKGLLPVENPSSLFLSGLSQVAGSVPTVILEGTRPMVVEIQALVVPTKLPFPRRTVQGLDSRRAELLLAVLSGRVQLPLANFDVLLNAVGGINVREPAADLAITLAIVSSFFKKPLPQHACAFGEVGLLGEVREVTQEERRVKEAKRWGFRHAIRSSTTKTIGEAIKRYISR